MRIRGWSSDVCSSDLRGSELAAARELFEPRVLRFEQELELTCRPVPVLADRKVGGADLRIGRIFFAIEEHRSEEHTSELQSLMRISYAVFCLKKKKNIELK